MNWILKIFILSLITSKLYCHPHTFIEVKPTINIKDEKIDNFNIQWTLDEMTSMMLIMELDTNGDGKFDKNENQYIFENYFSSLEKQNFYMKIYSKKKNIYIKTKNFKASIKKKRLIYSFNLDNTIDIKDLKVKFFDEDLFVGMILEKESIKLNGLDSKKSEKVKKSIFEVN